MSLAIHGLGTAVPPDALTPDDGLRIARFLAGPDVRTSTWLVPVYANSGIARRHQVIGGQVVRDIFEGTNVSGSPFLPTPHNDGVGPTTGERMRVYAEHAGPLAVRSSPRQRRTQERRCCLVRGWGSGVRVGGMVDLLR